MPAQGLNHEQTHSLVNEWKPDFLVLYKGQMSEASKLPPVKRVALFLRPKAVKQRKHESANVSFCDPVQSTGFPKQTIADAI